MCKIVGTTEVYPINTTHLGYLAQGKNCIESVSDMSTMEMKVVYKALSSGTLRGCVGGMITVTATCIYQRSCYRLSKRTDAATHS